MSIRIKSSPREPYCALDLAKFLTKNPSLFRKMCKKYASVKEVAEAIRLQPGGPKYVRASSIRGYLEVLCRQGALERVQQIEPGTGLRMPTSVGYKIRNLA